MARLLVPPTLRPKRLKRAPEWLYPRAAERAYVDFMNKNVGQRFREKVREILIPSLRVLVESERVLRPDSAEVRLDALSDEIKAMMIALTGSLERDEEEIDPEALNIATNVSNVNRHEMRKIVKTVLGVDPIGRDAGLAKQVDLFRSANVDLVANLNRKGVQDLNGIVQRGLQQGLRVGEIEKQINAKVKGIVSNAKLIARDQIAKLNGQITKERQESIGVSKYVWRTVKDERVRESHRAMDGKTCVWDDSTVYINADGKKRKRSGLDPSGVELHPGQDFQCRCTASPVLDDLIFG